MVHIDAWLNKVDEIAAEGPSYKLGHDGEEVIYTPPASRRPYFFRR